MPEGGATAESRVKLAEVAASAGVSVSTVSKVLHGRSDVGAATRARVQKALATSAYVPRRAGITPDNVRIHFGGPLSAYSQEILSGALDVAAQLKVGVTLTSQLDPYERDKRVLEALAGRQPLVLVTSELQRSDFEAIRKAHGPVVLIDPLNGSRPRLRTIGATNVTGGMTAAEHLLALGHRRIAFLGGPAGAPCNLERLQGYRAALEDAHVPAPAEYTLHGEFLFSHGLQGGGVLLDLPDPPTAIVAANDEIASGAMEAARQRGLRVPEDLSVVGFDDTSLARASSPPLTTVRQPLSEMGALALRTVLRLATDQIVEFNHVELATTLILRKSTAPCVARADRA
jgi:LacI family transcriptional regulator